MTELTVEMLGILQQISEKMSKQLVELRRLQEILEKQALQVDKEDKEPWYVRHDKQPNCS